MQAAVVEDTVRQMWSVRFKEDVYKRQVHNCSQTEQWYGPNAWRTTGDEWAYEYQLKAAGILKAPILQYQEKK